MVMRIDDKDYVHIAEFAALINHSVQSVRYLCYGGGRRQMSYIRDGSRILIPVAELTEYPFTSSGRNSRDQIYHYILTAMGYEKRMCYACTFKENVESCPEAMRLYSMEEGSTDYDRTEGRMEVYQEEHKPAEEESRNPTDQLH